MKESLTGNVKEHHRKQLAWAKEEYDMYQRQTADCLKEMKRICDDNFELEIRLLKTLPGISEIAAMTIIAETGGDMSIFENSGKITGWAGLCPRNDESAGKYKSTATTKGSYFKEKVARLAMRKPID